MRTKVRKIFLLTTVPQNSDNLRCEGSVCCIYKMHINVRLKKKVYKYKYCVYWLYIGHFMCVNHHICQQVSYCNIYTFGVYKHGWHAEHSGVSTWPTCSQSKLITLWGETTSSNNINFPWSCDTNGNDHCNIGNKFPFNTSIVLDSLFCYISSSVSLTACLNYCVLLVTLSFV